jgi:hypothetical protein
MPSLYRGKSSRRPSRGSTLCRPADPPTWFASPTKAHDLLAPIHGWFTEGFGTPDLKDAKAFLEELRL